MSNITAEYESIKDEIDAAFQRVIRSGNFTLGEEVDLFEQELAQYCQSSFMVGVGSGTAAIELTLRAYGIGPGDEVITVPNTDIPTTAAITHTGARVVFVDIDPVTWNIDPSKIEAKITPRTKVILPVDLHGYPADRDAIREIAQKHGLIVIFDSALSLGAEYKGDKVGSYGHATCLSLAPTKVLGAFGDAGAVATNDARIADRIKVLRNYGHSLEMEAGQEGLLGFSRWEFIEEGYNERLDALQAAILRAKLPTLDRMVEKRRAIASRYNNQLSSLGVSLPLEAGHIKHVYRAYTILVDRRDTVRNYLTSREIATHIYYCPPLHLQPAYHYLGHRPGDFPAAEMYGDRMLNLPIFPEMTAEQVDRVVAALDECVSTHD